MKTNFLQQFDRLTSKTKSAFDKLEMARRSPNEGDLVAALEAVVLCLSNERRMAGGGVKAKYADDPETRAFWSALARKLGGGSLSEADVEILRAKSLDMSTQFGSASIPESEVQKVLSIAYEYGAFRTLGEHPLASDKLKAAKITGIPTAVFVMPDFTGAQRTIPADTSLSGSAVTGECNSVSCLLEPSIELMQDSKVDLGIVLLQMCGQAIANRLDFGSFMGDGTADVTHGGQTGIFKHADVENVSANAGNTLVESLQLGDFMKPVGAITAAALQRECRYWVNPTFLPKLMQLKDGNQYLVKSPSETGGEWQLCRFPMTLTAVAPSENAANKPILAFGRGEAYLVTVREQLEMISTGGAKWQNAIRSIRAVARARCEMQDADSFAILKTAGA